MICSIKLFLLFYFFFISIKGHKTYSDPFAPGDLPVNQTVIFNAITIATDTNIAVFAPNIPGNFPVLYFITGLAGLVPTLAYTNVLTRIASHGIIALGIWKVDNPIDSFNATWFDETVNFVESRLERYLHNEGFDEGMHVDYLNSFIAGHSSGAHVPVAIAIDNFLLY